VAERELGAVWMGVAIAPLANLLLFDAYEERGLYRNCINTQNDVGMGDVLRLSFGFRAAIIVTVASVLTNLFSGARMAMAADEPPVVVQTTTYLDLEDEDAKADNEIRLVAPMNGGNAAQFDYNLSSSMFDFGVRGRTRTLAGTTKFQPRLIAVFNSGDWSSFKLQGLFMGKGWSLFSSLKLPEGKRASLYNELATDVGKIGPVGLQAVLIESGAFGERAGWQLGPLVDIPVGDGTLSVLACFGLGGGGPGDQLRVQYTIPIN